MKKLFSFLAVALLTASAHSETFRVNNTPGSGAQYTTFDEAQSAASEGDVIIFDGSDTSYGEIEVTKRLTLKGPGYFLGENEATSEGTPVASFKKIKVTAAGTTLTGLVVDESYILLNASNVVVTRCYAREISLSADYSYSDKGVSNCIIHQNYIRHGITGDNYSAHATFIQITNNIIAEGYNAVLMYLDQSTISRNTIISGESGYRCITNCVIENNIAPEMVNDVYTIMHNTFKNNHFTAWGNKDLYKEANPRNDKTIKAVDATIATDKGAFSGDDPYVLSGLPSGPMIKDIIMPESVVQGENLKVIVNIGTSK